MNIQSKKVGFLGDSITEGVGSTTVDNIYHQVLKNSCGLATAVNYGISGTRIAKQTNPSEDSSYDKFFLSRVDDMEADLDIVVVFGGTNDYGHGDAAFGNFSDRREDTFYGALHLLSQKLIDKYPQSLIIYITPLHRFDEMEYIVKPDRECRLLDYVNAICEVARFYSIPVLDLYAVSGMNPAINAQNNMFYTDGLHPSDMGHRRIAERLEGFLKAL